MVGRKNSRVFSSSVQQKNSCYPLNFQSVWRVLFHLTRCPIHSHRIKIKHAKLLRGSDNALLKPSEQEHTQSKAAWGFWTPADPRSSLTFACTSEGLRHRECLSRWPKDYMLTKSSTWLTSWSLPTLQQNPHPYAEANKVPWRGWERN